MAAQRNGSMAQWLQSAMAAQRSLNERRVHDERCSGWANAASKSVEESGTYSSASDVEFWCDNGTGPSSRGAAAAAHEFARFAYWNGKDRRLMASAMALYTAAVNGTAAEGRAAVQAAFAMAATTHASPSGLADTSRPSLDVLLSHASAASRLARLALLPCSPRGEEWLTAAAAIAEHQCLATPYHTELLRRSAAVAFPSELLTTPRPHPIHGDGVHPGQPGHQLMAERVEAVLLSGCQQMVPRAAPAAFPDQSCRFGHRIAELVTGTSGFAFVDPGDSRTPGFAATVQGSTITLRLASREPGGFVSLAYEAGWRNHAIGRLSCHGGCVCRPASMNATSHYKATYSKFSEPVWATLGGTGVCTVRVVQPGHSPPLGGAAPARLLCLLRARLAALGASALPGECDRALSAQPLPRVLELAACKAADFTAFDHSGTARCPGPRRTSGAPSSTDSPPPAR